MSVKWMDYVALQCDVVIAAAAVAIAVAVSVMEIGSIV